MTVAVATRRPRPDILESVVSNPGASLRIALSVGMEDQHLDELRTRWAQLCSDIDLEVVESPYREFTKPILAFLDALDRQAADDVITVVIPEFVVHRWWQQALHNQSALILKGRLLFRPNTVVISVPSQLD